MGRTRGPFVSRRGQVTDVHPSGGLQCRRNISHNFPEDSGAPSLNPGSVPPWALLGFLVRPSQGGRAPSRHTAWFLDPTELPFRRYFPRETARPDRGVETSQPRLQTAKCSPLVSIPTFRPSLPSPLPALEHLERRRHDEDEDDRDENAPPNRTRFPGLIRHSSVLRLRAESHNHDRGNRIARPFQTGQSARPTRKTTDIGSALPI
jgi:hypothetical protein